MTRFFLVFTALLFWLSSCQKNMKNDPRSKYVGDWNFKGNSYNYSGYYIYTPDAEWTYTESTSTDYNDSTGTVALGNNSNELILKYCSSCEPIVYDLNQNGVASWTISETEFYNDVTPNPPGYSPSYSTYNIQGWKLD